MPPDDIGSIISDMNKILDNLKVPALMTVSEYLLSMAKQLERAQRNDDVGEFKRLLQSVEKTIAELLKSIDGGEPDATR